MSRARKALFGLLVSVVLLAMLGWLWLTRLAHGFSSRAEPSVIEEWTARAARGLALPVGAKRLKNPVPSSDQALEDARAHWADHCAFCHSNDGSGASEVGRNLYPKAPDMRAARTQALTDGELYYTIKNGVRLTGMPAWGEAGDQDEDSWKLVHFIRHLPKMTPQEMEDMKKLNPQSPMEMMEDNEEEQFLEGSDNGKKVTPRTPPQEHKKGSTK
jgi:mono/diheme cytochrome c family protein